jgi:pyruvate,orthophosphate dikinase
MSVESTSPSRPTAKQWVFSFEEGSAEMRGLLGGKGANLAEMTHVLGSARVPGGFTITTEACVEYMKTDERFPEGLEEEIAQAVTRLEQDAGQQFGGGSNPLLLSVRSGASVSMPGMLDTVLNLGLNAESVETLSEASGNPRFAWDSFRRLVQMYSDVVRGVPAASFEDELVKAREATGSAVDADLEPDALRELTERFLALFTEHTGEPFPEDPREQLRGAVEAVFRSWNNDRAIAYRRFEGIPDELGTAVTVQRMVFGNRGADSGSGVAFTRDPTTGAPEPEGDFLLNAQGEDVVAGVRNTEDLADLARRMPEAHVELIDALKRLERHYRDMQDVEYTIERGRLYILQTRNAKRPAQAAVRFASDAVDEGLLGRDEALATVEPGSLDALLHPTFDPEQSYTELTRAVPASPGGAKGAIVFTAEEAEKRGEAGDDVILVREFTSADDVGGFHAAKGVLTSRGGKSSHAAIVARGMGRPCVCGASELEIDLDAGVVSVGGTELHAGDTIAIDGSTGVVTADDVRLIEPKVGEDFAAVLSWADEIRRLGVRANADTAEDAARARELGAEGIGLCRTEHMFFGSDREELVRDMFIAGELWRRGREQSEAGSGVGKADDPDPAEQEFTRALDGLREMQKADLIQIFGAMSGLPVTIRLLDPPIHEFISIPDFEQALEEAEREADSDAIERSRVRLAVARELEETNPMLGTRGARLGLLLPPLYEMQVAAILEAALAVAATGKPPKAEIMIPLIAFEGELETLRDLVHLRAERVMHDAGAEVEYSVGTMIELPRACLRAGEIAANADFFSFGTNDLTQTTLGLSRDDAEGSFLPIYLSQRILVRSPFETIDIPGVGELVKIAVERGRATRPDLHLGVCGEHGGDPASIEFFDSAGLDYVSCSPFRVPIARVAAAQAAAETAPPARR